MNPLTAKTARILESRHQRKKAGLCLVEGLRCCREAIQRRPELLESLCCTEDFLKSPHAVELGINPQELQVIPQEQFQKLTETESAQGVLATLRIPHSTSPTTAGSPFTLILDHLADPGNMGTILRTAWAIGMDQVWLVRGSADPWAPKCIRAGMGAQFAVATHVFEDLEQAVKTAKKFGTKKVWCTMPGCGISLFDQEFHLQGTALIIGNEANGITRPELGSPVTIPMPGHAESLNAAQAATVFLIEALRK